MKQYTLFLALLVLAGCTTTAPTMIDTVPDVPGEVLYNDVFFEEIPSDEISVLGIMLGDTIEDIITLHGEPSISTDYNFGTITNLEYNFSQEDTAVLYHVEQGVVTGILITSYANDFLVGESKIEGGLEKMYGLLGNPSAQEDLYRERVYAYDDLGYEVYTKGNLIDRIFLTTPNRGLNTGKETPELCAQVITPAVNDETNECIEFPTPCSIPEGWSVVEACS